MTNEEIAPQTPMPIDLNDPEVNRRRERRIFYREHWDTDGKSVGWFPTLPLPSDPWHMTYYINKGFKLFHPDTMTVAEAKEVGEVVAKPHAVSCPVSDCSFLAKTYIGLARHMSKKHNLK